MMTIIIIITRHCIGIGNHIRMHNGEKEENFLYRTEVPQRDRETEKVACVCVCALDKPRQIIRNDSFCHSPRI